ncbi:TonB-dependent receptor domain-containing protein [Deefgea sp. CFH1-16]|uniref:TonB-dependent receptor domain-containing protein n=1 Tax=Deefgea sp. CFH1-16 TaxID=2675457 RepID=UPI0015F38314|nr:TonB-dependent receptor [Deefgea sp. CFH1-16]
MNTSISKTYLLILSALASIPAMAEVTQLNDVVVTATRIAQPLREVVGDVTVLDREAIAAQGNSSLQEVLSRQPGIQISNSGGPGKSTSVYLRGANNSQTLVLIDGVNFGSATLGGASLQNIPLDQIERVEILRGPAASLYGSGAIGGVIQIFTRQGKAKSSVEIGYGNHNTVDAKATLAGGDEATRYSITAAHFKTDGVNAIVNPKNSNYNPDQDGYENNSLSLAAQHKINTQHAFGVSALGAWGENHYDGSISNSAYKPVAQSYDYRDKSFNGSANVWSKNQWNDIWTSHIKAGTSIDEGRNYTPFSATNYQDKVSKIKTQQTLLSWVNDVSILGGTLQVGAETLGQKVTSDTDYSVNHRRINSVLAGYLVTVSDVTLQLNGRSDDNSQYGRNNTGTLGLAWQMNDDWSLGTTMGTAFKAPSFNDLYWPGSGNPNVKPEESNSKEVFVRFANNRFQSALTVYENKVTNLIEWAPTPSGLWQPSNIGTAKLGGATLTADWQSAGYIAGASYDYLDARDTSSGANKDRQLARRAKHAGVAYVGLQTPVWMARVEIQAQGQRFDDAANKKVLAGYALTNLAASYQIDKDWSLHARVNNLFNRDYQLATDYGNLGINGIVSVRWQPK